MKPRNFWVCFLTLQLLFVNLWASDSTKTKRFEKTFLRNEGLIITDSDSKTYSYKPLQVKLSDDGAQYIRFIIWHQQWLSTSNLANKNANLQLDFMARRSRFLTYAQLNPNILILSHWGLNNLTGSNMSPLGNDADEPQLFLHDAWTEFKINDALYIGTGLLYYNGLTRLSSASTLNFLMIDQVRPFAHWHSLGMADQFGRGLGIYAKGIFNKFAYRLTWTNPMKNPFKAGVSYGDITSDFAYTGASNLTSGGDKTGNNIIQGYVNYFFGDVESTKLPFWVGTYLGTKNVFNIGAGFYYHGNGMYNTVTNKHSNVLHLAVDTFMDKPVGNDLSVTAYASLIKFDYGKNFMARWGGTGTNIFVQSGLYHKKSKIMPYFGFQLGNYEGLNKALTSLNVGASYYLFGNSAKISVEYHNVSNFAAEKNGNTDNVNSQIRMQAHVFF
ncbi:hypothetical protein EP331_07790 [bacterium]|nr:MAG: hypothetical protein EP331_07790 [bacterium]